ncbi:HLA class II histocompatibility antigen, DM beta chain-like [Emydura macquarii macquarii]|uniref:HLA class II histocompatibility antigen, DM beta chain-like n=1 Tax=Emydura macquarii macquarii TaxID=1129001 RepID=UPI00352A8FB6
MKLVLWLLSLALSHHAAGGFLMHLASECPLAANGSVLWFGFSLVFNKNPLVCYNEQDRLFEACDMGLLNKVAQNMTTFLNRDPGWLQRMAGGRQACQSQGQRLWGQTAQRMTRPHVRIVSTALANPAGAVRLTCHVWGFYPAAVRVSWWHDGRLVDPRQDNLTAALANGDWTYQTHVTLLVTPQPGDTYACRVQHPSLPQDYLEEWRPGLSPGLTVKVSVAVVVLSLGLIFLITGMVYWYRAPAPGYSPLLGHNYPGGST